MELLVLAAVIGIFCFLLPTKNKMQVESRTGKLALQFNTKIGVETPTCPYCGCELVKFPGRKTKCKKCENYIYVRTRPADGKRILIKENEKQLIQIEWEKKNGTFEIRQMERNEFAQIKQKLQKLRKCDFVPDNDVYWNLYQERHLKELAEERWIDYAHTTNDMANLLYKEQKYGGALEHYLEALYIDICIPHHEETGGQCRQLFSSRENILKYRSCYPVAAFSNCINEVNLNIEQIKEIFMSLMIPQIPFPISRLEAWKIIENKLMDSQTILN